MLVGSANAEGKVEFTSDLVCSTITYWFGDQASDQVSGQAGEQAGEQVQRLEMSRDWYLTSWAGGMALT